MANFDFSLAGLFKTMRKKIRRPSGVGHILEKVIKNLGIAGQVHLVRIMTGWEKILGPPVSRVTFPRDLKAKTLFVDVENSVWLQQLSFMDSMIMEKINAFIGSKVVNKIRFGVGALPERSVDEGKDQAEALEDMELSNEDLDEIRDCAEAVSDLELRKTLRRILMKDRKLKKIRLKNKP